MKVCRVAPCFLFPYAVSLSRRNSFVCVDKAFSQDFWCSSTEESLQGVDLKHVCPEQDVF